VTFRGKVSTKAASWNGSLLYKTFLEHEPDHPLVKEAIRTVLEDECDGNRAHREAKRIVQTPFEVYDLPRPSPLALPLFSAFNRETLLAQDPDRALDDLVNRLFEEWNQ
jgi:ATP-dependent helicase Lhr and Lhr-like helicase